MQLTQFTDYALRVLIYIAVKNETCTIKEIAESYNISRNHLIKIVHKLGQIGVIKTIRGKNGGIQLNALPSEINIGEIVKQTEPHFFLVECLDQVNGKCCIAPACKLKQVLNKAKNEFIQTICGYTLEDVIPNTGELKVLLKI